MQGKHYYQGFNPQRPSQLSKQTTGNQETNTSRNGEENLAKEDFLAYISRLAKKYDTKDNGTAKHKQLKVLQKLYQRNDLKQNSNTTAAMTTTTMSDCNCEIEEDTREDQESDSVNSSKQKLSGSQSYRGGQVQANKGNLLQYKGIQKIIEQQISGRNKHYQLASQEAPSQSLSQLAMNKRQQANNNENSYQYYFCNNPRLSQKEQRSPRKNLESPLVFVPFEARERKVQQVIRPKTSSTLSASKKSQMKFFNSKRSLQSNTGQYSDRSNSGTHQATSTTAKTARELDITSWNNNSFSRNTNISNMKNTMELSGNINKTSCYFQQNKGQSNGCYLKPKLENFLVQLRGDGRNEEGKGKCLFMEVQNLKVQRNYVEKENKGRKEKITMLEKEIKQMKKQLRSWGINDTYEYDQALGCDQNGYRAYDEQFRQLELRDERVDMIYEDPNFYEFSFKRKVKEMDGLVNGLDEIIRVQKDVMKKPEVDRADLQEFEIALGEGYCNLLETQIKCCSTGGPGDSSAGCSAIENVIKLNESYKYHQSALDRMKNSIETVKKEIEIRKETNVSFVQSIDRIMKDKITRDIQIEELKPKVERLIKTFKEIQASRRLKWKRQKQQEQEYEIIGVNLGKSEDSITKEGEMRGKSNKREYPVGDQDGQRSDRSKIVQQDEQEQQLKQQQDLQDTQNISQQNQKKPSKKLDRFSYVNDIKKQSNPLIREKYRAGQQIDQIHRQSAELNQLKLQYQIFRGNQIIREQQSNRVIKKLSQEIEVLKEANMKILNSIVKKHKIIIEFQREKEFNKEQEQMEQGNEREINQLEDYEGDIIENENNEGNDMKDQKLSSFQSQQQQEQKQSPLKIIKQQQKQLERQEQFLVEISKRGRDISTGNMRIEDENISQISWDSLNAECGDPSQSQWEMLMLVKK